MPRSGNNKKTVCITGTVWTGRRNAPRRMLVRDGFIRPRWFTTDRPLTDADYRRISRGRFHLARARDEVLVATRYGNSFVGVLRADYEAALTQSKYGVLIVGPPEIAAALATEIPNALIFALKDVQMDLSAHLEQAQQRGQLHRIDVDVLEPGAWTQVYGYMMDTLGRPVRKLPF